MISLRLSSWEVLLLEVAIRDYQDPGFSELAKGHRKDLLNKLSNSLDNPPRVSHGET